MDAQQATRPTSDGVIVLAALASEIPHPSIWREHALVMHAIVRAMKTIHNAAEKGAKQGAPVERLMHPAQLPTVKLLILGHGEVNASYREAIQVYLSAEARTHESLLGHSSNGVHSIRGA